MWSDLLLGTICFSGSAVLVLVRGSNGFRVLYIYLRYVSLLAQELY